MRVLVTGAGGLIGSHVVRALSATGTEVVSAGRGPTSDVVVDLAVAGAPAAVIREVRPDRVVHLAWPDDDRINDLAGIDWVGHTATLLRACVDHGVGHVVTAGTCFEYELGASQLKAGVSPERPVTVYGAAKLAVHDLLIGLVAAGALDGAHARIFYVYGEGERPPRLVPAVGLALLRGEEIATTDGAQRRDYVHVADVGAALATLCRAGVSGTYDIASGRAVAVSEIIDGLESRIAGGRVDRGALPRRDGDPDAVVGDPGTMAAVGWRPTIGLDEGLDRTVDWLRVLHEGKDES